MYEEQLSVYSQQLFKMTIWTFFSLGGLENKEYVCVCVSHEPWIIFYFTGSILKYWVIAKRAAFLFLFPTKQSCLKIEKEEETAKSSKQICCEKTTSESNLGWDSIKTCLLCMLPSSAQDCTSLGKSGFILGLAWISVLGKLEISSFIESGLFTCYNWIQK